MAPPVRVAIVDDHELLLEGLKIAIAHQDGFEVTLCAASVGEFKDLARPDDFDVVLTDLGLADGSGADIAALCAAEFAKPVLLMTGQSEGAAVRVAIASGCVGFLSKGASLDVVCDALRVAADGGTVFPAALFRTALAQRVPPDRGITDREMSVLVLLANGQSAADITTELEVSLHTVRNHIRSLLAKLHATSQLEAVVRAVREGIVVIEPD